MLFTEYFGLDKSQSELDFVDIPIDKGDVPLFIDPYAISLRTDPWSQECHELIIEFFQKLIDTIRLGNETAAKSMLANLGEPNQIKFGLSSGDKARGRGIGPDQADDLYDAFAKSNAVKTGFLSALEDCELLIPGIARDKISDTSVNIIKYKLVQYTQNQCRLLDIPMVSKPAGKYWNNPKNLWESHYADLPECNRMGIILVPKAIVRFDLLFNHSDYYNNFVLEFLQTEHLRAGSSLVRTLKDGTKKPPYKKILKKSNPLTKEYLYDFTSKHIDVLNKYKGQKANESNSIRNSEIVEITDGKVVDIPKLIVELSNVPIGQVGAHQYEKCIIGILNSIFYPNLINPKSQQTENEGRKRVDITYENAAETGFFSRLHLKFPRSSLGYIMCECKNYSQDVANPELDQMIGRLSKNRSQMGLIICRTIVNSNLLIKRCRDAHMAEQGTIICLEDKDIITLLNYKQKGNHSGIDSFMDDKLREVVI